MSRSWIVWFLTIEGSFLLACGAGWALGYNSKDWVLPLVLFWSGALLSFLAAWLLNNLKNRQTERSDLNAVVISLGSHISSLQRFGREILLFRENNIWSNLWSVDQVRELSWAEAGHVIFQNIGEAPLILELNWGQGPMIERRLLPQDMMKWRLSPRSSLRSRPERPNEGSLLLLHYFRDSEEILDGA